jgi:tetratricopeptide (TPR) repeat protein/tRNA A-37 threonylcarbamoyl transferase component Bud32
MPDETPSPLEPPADESTLTASPGTVQGQLTARRGDRFGRYKILEEIGQGGCGAVFVAEQEEPVRRRVALKVIKLGMDTRQVIARFEAERQALAMMDHPNIARVLDAGATDTGRPFFVMELVRGIKITDYCDQHKLSTTDRLKLFIQVCQAVQHAHQKGIIHRDLKPSNILVTLQDGVPTPKVIDFGIAKATADQKLTDKTVYTAFEQFIGTPAYMSPEQAEMTGLDIDTRSDIYSLGVLLYELLTSETPFSSEELLGVGLDAMRRVLREKDPARPSTKLSTMTAADLTAIALHRHSEPPKLIKSVRGDLDWIVMKCLEKERHRRYETANGLAVDIQRHLASEPVVACPPTNLYRLQRLVRRNKVVFGAAAAVAAALVFGLGLSTWLFFGERAARRQAGQQARVAQEQAALAKEQEAIAQAVNHFLTEDVLRQADPRAQGYAGFTPNPNLTVREAVERAADRIGERFRDQPHEEAAVRCAIGVALLELGEAERAALHLKRALDLHKAILGPDDRDTLRNMGSLAAAYYTAGKLDQAQPLFEETLKAMKLKLGPDNTNTLTLMNNLANTYLNAGKFAQALPLLEETLRLRKIKLGPDDPNTLISMNNLARGYQDIGKNAQALPLLEETLTLRKARLAPDHPDTLSSMNNLAIAYRDAGKLDQAQPLFEETLSLRKTRLGPDHPDTLVSMNNLASVYQDAGKLDQALPLFEETFKLTKIKLGPDHPSTLRSMNNLASAYRAAGNFEQAMPLLEEALTLRKARLGPDHPATLASMNSLARGYQAAGKLDQALPLFEETLALRKAKLGPDHPDTLGSMLNLAGAYRDAGKLDQALPLLEQTFKVMKVKLGPEHPTTLVSMNNLASVYQAAGKLDQALPLFEEALTLQKTKLGADHPDTLVSMNNLATAYQDAGKFEQALPLLEQTLTLRKARLGPDHPDTLASMNSLARGYQDVGKLDQALPLFEETLTLRKAKLGPDHPDTLTSMNNLAMAYRAAGKFDQALPLLEQTFELMKSKLGPDHRTTLVCMNNLASVYRDAGKLEQALPLFEQTLALIKAKLGPDHPDALASMYDLGVAYLRVGKPAESERLASECLGSYEAKSPDNWRTFSTRSLLGGSLLAQKKYADAEPLLLSGYEGMKQREERIPATAKSRLTEAIKRLVQLFQETNRPDEAAKWKEKLATLENVSVDKPPKALPK